MCTVSATPWHPVPLLCPPARSHFGKLGTFWLQRAAVAFPPGALYAGSAVGFSLQVSANVQFGMLDIKSPLAYSVVAGNDASDVVPLSAAVSHVFSNVFGVASAVSGVDSTTLPRTDAFARPRAALFVTVPGLSQGAAVLCVRWAPQPMHCTVFKCVLALRDVLLLAVLCCALQPLLPPPSPCHPSPWRRMASPQWTVRACCWDGFACGGGRVLPSPATGP